MNTGLLFSEEKKAEEFQVSAIDGIEFFIIIKICSLEMLNQEQCF